MKKRVTVLIMLFALLLSSIPVLASDAPIIFNDTITVTEDGGIYQIGFVTVKFKKDFLDAEMLSATFDVEIYAVNGVGYIDFTPDVDNFNKKVIIKAEPYDGLLYDKATGKNVEINIKKQTLVVDHFSRYAWRR